MGRTHRRRRSAPDPREPDGPGTLPSDQLPRSVTVKLDAGDRRVLGRCRRLLAGSEGDTYPTVSRTLRLALRTLFHSLTGHPPEGGNDEKL